MPGPDAARKRKTVPAARAPASPADLLESLAASPEVSEALRLFARERRWIDAQHLAVCRVPAPTFREQERAEWMAGEFKTLGWEASVDRAGNVVATFGPARNGPLVAVTAHLDTVLSPRTPEEVRFEKDRLLGPGVADNGAGLAALLALARALSMHPTLLSGSAGLLLAANVGEEGEGNLSGMKHLCRNSPLAARLQSILVLDGPDTAHITAEALACRRFEITVNGPGGHSWSDRGEANTIHALARFISWYTDARQEQASQRACSWNFGVIEGGTTVNAIPATARVKVDLRAESPSDLDELSDSLSLILEKALLEENQRAESGRVTGRIKETGSRPGGRLAEDDPMLRCIQAVDAHLGIRSYMDCASTDANIPLSMGLPAMSIGAGGQGGGAHTVNEWYSAQARDLGLRRVLLLTLLLLAGASAGEP